MCVDRYDTKESPGRIVNKEGCQPVPIVAYTRVPPSPPLDPGPKLGPTQSVRRSRCDPAAISLATESGRACPSSFVWSRGRGGSSGESARRVLLHVFRGRGSNFGNNKYLWHLTPRSNMVHFLPCPFYAHLGRRDDWDSETGRLFRELSR
ncbi:hypothetical protein EDB86DRAFT_3244402 [Lactarius hatsudake]|nr:hypothetical protein EDB86DRAFT_3244402 [Lactarius hatsudake]